MDMNTFRWQLAVATQMKFTSESLHEYDVIASLSSISILKLGKITDNSKVCAAFTAARLAFCVLYNGRGEVCNCWQGLYTLCAARQDNWNTSPQVHGRVFVGAAVLHKPRYYS